MAIWFQIAIALNVVYWSIFFYLLSRRRWNGPALAVGIFHMLFAALFSVAPIRSFLDPDYVGYAIGVIHFEKRAVVIPATLVLGWALAAAWVAVGKGSGRWMRLVMVGDLLFALSMAAAIVLDGSQNWTFQLGEQYTATGVKGLFILLSFITLPFIASAIWAASRIKKSGTTPPLASSTRDEREGSEKDGEDTTSYRYVESHI